MSSSPQPRSCYFLAPKRTSPQDGYIGLGNISSDPSGPDETLNTEVFLPNAASISTHVERNRTHTINHTSKNRIGILSFLLKLLAGAGADTSFTSASAEYKKYTVRATRWREFRPTLDYIKQAVADEGVQGYIKDNRFQQKIYMIVGVMEPSGASGVVNAMREQGIYAHIGVDGTILSGEMAPVGGGLKGQYQARSSVEESYKAIDEFVFAFRLGQIKVRKTGGLPTRRSLMVRFLE